MLGLNFRITICLHDRSSPTVSDLYNKKRAYRRNGVKEYLVWRVYDQEFDWFYLEKGEYIKLSADEQGVIRSVTFPGLWLSVSALLSGKMEEVLAILQQGLNSEEHQDFVQDIAE